jgi:hypothetical protein
MKHLLVTNDFPPKVGGIQNLLWEWWRRLPPDSFAVLTSPHKDAAEFDAQQPYLIRRTKEPVLLPHPWMIQRINDMAEEIGADFIVLDPAVPLGIVGPSLKLPYMVVLHGSEVTVPGRLPGSKQVLARVCCVVRNTSLLPVDIPLRKLVKPVAKVCQSPWFLPESILNVLYQLQTSNAKQLVRGLV